MIQYDYNDDNDLNILTKYWMSLDSLCRFIAHVKSVQWKRADLTRPQLER